MMCKILRILSNSAKFSAGQPVLPACNYLICQSVGLSVGLLVCPVSELWKNGWLDLSMFGGGFVIVYTVDKGLQVYGCNIASRNISVWKFCRPFVVPAPMSSLCPLLNTHNFMTVTHNTVITARRRVYRSCARQLLLHDFVAIILIFTRDSVAIARICHGNSVRLSVCPSHGWISQKR